MLVLQNEVSSQYDPKGVTNEDNQEKTHKGGKWEMLEEER